MVKNSTNINKTNNRLQP